MTPEQDRLVKQCKAGVDIYSLPDSVQQDLLWLANVKGYCQQDSGVLASTLYVLTPAGDAYLSSLEQADKERAEKERKQNEQIAKADEDRKKQFRHDWRVYIVSAVAGSVFTLIVEHFFDILAFLALHSH